MDTYEEFDDRRIKHLELIQAVISRLGNNGFLTKGWALTVAGALMGFAVSSGRAWLSAVSLLPTVLFWWLDGFFLRAERIFRCLYDRVRDGDDQVPPFFMSAMSPRFTDLLTNEQRAQISRSKILRRPALVYFYAAIAIAAVAVVAGLLLTSGPTKHTPHESGRRGHPSAIHSSLF